MIEINRERCKGCGLCAQSCPKKIIGISDKERNEKGLPTAYCTDNSACISCKMCALMCPECAIKVFKEE